MTGDVVTLRTALDRLVIRWACEPQCDPDDHANDCDRRVRLYGRDLDALIAAVRADATRAAEAEVAGLRAALARLLPPDAIIDSCGDYEDIEVGYRCQGWEAREWRALAAQPAAPECICAVTGPAGGGHPNIDCPLRALRAQPAAPEAER